MERRRYPRRSRTPSRRTGIAADAAARRELAEDLTARSIDRCVALLDRDGVPEHIRALTSANVLQIENDLVGGLAVRGAQSGHDLAVPAVAAAAERSQAYLDSGQAAAVATLAGDRPLVVVEGAAGAGKTTLLRVTRSFVTEQGHRSNVVTPTLKAAQAATIELQTRASSGAKLAYAHGFRWDADGTWTVSPLVIPTRRPAASTPVPATGSGSSMAICSWSTRRGC